MRFLTCRDRAIEQGPAPRAPANVTALARRGAFTLVEMLVVVAIVLTLTTLVVVVFQTNRGSDRMRSAARIAQSTVMGARERAQLARLRRGVRFIRDASDSSLVVGLAYIQPLQPNPTYGLHPNSDEVTLERQDSEAPFQVADSARVYRVRGMGSGIDWVRLKDEGYLANPPRVRIPATTGRWFGIQSLYVNPSNSNEQLLELATDFPDFDAGFEFPSVLAIPKTSSKATCELELGSGLLPHHAPLQFPASVVIDLDLSSPQIVSLWPAPVEIDIYFAPNGRVVDAAAVQGPLYFVLNDREDALVGRNPIAPDNKGEKLILAVFPQTGLVQTFPIDPTDVVNNNTGAAGADGLADDLFKFAKIRSVAGQ
jgi:prepilin-type N-terminal cleavage/methylation domain-containing protein